MKVPRPLIPVLIAVGLLIPSLHAQVSMTVSPSAIGADYTGPITLQITGLTNGETVRVLKFLDANTNGTVDSPDLCLMGVTLRDGQASVIGGVTNINVPFDQDPTSGSIKVQFNQLAAGFEQKMPGQYIYRLISPSDRFAPVEQMMAMTNAGYGQSISGTVSSGGSPIPYSLVVLFPPSTKDMGYPVASAIADGSGHYSITVPVGSYSLMAAMSNYVADLSAMQSVTLAGGASATADLNLIPATTSISGNFYDPVHSNNAFTGLGVAMISSDQHFAFGLTSTNGAFSVPVTVGRWEVNCDERNNIAMLRYLRPGDKIAVDTSTGSVSGLTINMTRVSALIYGTVKDSNNNPLPGLAINSDNNGVGGMGLTDSNGNFVVGVTGGNWGWSFDNNPNLAGVVFSGMDMITLNDGEAVRHDLVAVEASHTISGHLKDSGGNPISGISIWANANINGSDFNVGNQGTDTNGFFSLLVPNGVWMVGVSSGGWDNSLDNSYLMVPAQTVTISNNDATVNFVAYKATAQIQGVLTNQSGSPISNVWVNAVPENQNGQSFFGASTDGNGYYSIGVTNGTWTVMVNCWGNQQSLQSLGYDCVEQQTTTVSNSNAIVNFSASVCPPFQVAFTNLPYGKVGVNYWTQLAAFGCNAPFFWSLAPSNSLPADMQLANDGTIFGTPMNAGTYSFQVQATDNQGQQTQAMVTLNIMPQDLQMVHLSVSQWMNNRFDMQVSGSPNQNYSIQFTTNLGGTNWIPLYLTNSPFGAFNVSDLSATNSQRFYRVMPVP